MKKHPIHIFAGVITPEVTHSQIKVLSSNGTWISDFPLAYSRESKVCALSINGRRIQMSRSSLGFFFFLIAMRLYMAGVGGNTCKTSCFKCTQGITQEKVPTEKQQRTLHLLDLHGAYSTDLDPTSR